MLSLRRVLPLVTFLLVTDLLSACTLTPTAEEMQTLRVALPSFGAEVLDPSRDQQMGLLYHGALFDHLVGAGPDGKMDPKMGLLERWEVNDDATQYTLKLREGMRWHDGVEITAEDIVFSLNHYPREMATCEACSTLETALERVEALDRYTARLHLRRPDAEFIHNLGPVQGDMPLLPKHYWEKVGATGFEERPIGSGPWRFVRRVKGEYIEFEANRDYWDPDRAPRFDRLRLVLGPTPDDRLAMLRSGEVDMTVVRLDDIETLRQEGFQIMGPRYVMATTLRMFMSYDPDYLTSRLEFRKALALGMDLKSIVAEFYPSEAAAVAPGVPFASPLAEGWDPAFAPYPYDPETARALLDEIGYQGETVYLMSIAAYGLVEMPQFNERIAEDWREIGLNVELYPTDYPPIKSRYAARPQDFADVAPAPIFHGAHENRPGIISSLWRYMTSYDTTVMAYPDLEKGDRLYAEISGIADPQEREARLRQVFHEWQEEYWAINTTWRHDTYALRPGLSGWQPTDGTHYDLRLETVQPAD